VAHRDWCGKPCADCANPCKLDESIPCSPDCENLFLDGEYDPVKCNEARCDAITDDDADVSSDR